MTTFVISKGLQPYDSKAKPCKNARAGSAEMYVGTNITVSHKVWLINISSLVELLKLEEEVGTIVILNNSSAFNIPEIEIQHLL